MFKAYSPNCTRVVKDYHTGEKVGIYDIPVQPRLDNGKSYKVDISSALTMKDFKGSGWAVYLGYAIHENSRGRESKRLGYFGVT